LALRIEKLHKEIPQTYSIYTSNLTHSVSRFMQK
jgi:hypothetical protein